MFSELFFLLASFIFVYWGYRILQERPELFKGKVLLKSSQTLAVLAALLLCIVVLSIMFLRNL